jgi:hypothetical protein
MEMNKEAESKQGIDWGKVARWFVFKPKIQIWETFGGSCNGR